MHPLPKTCLATALLMLAAPFATVAAADKSPALKPYDNALQAEARSKDLCEKVPGRLFVTAGKASECVAYFVTSGHQHTTHAVIYLDGDTSLEKYQDHEKLAKARDARQSFLQKWADRLGQRYIDISRLGINGSSGNHGARRKPHETVIMNEAIDLLKAKLGLDSVTLAGQSGGSTIAAGLLTFGRKDIQCAVLGSGAYEIVDLDHAFRVAKGAKVDKAALAKVMYDPSKNIDGIFKDPARRIFVLGDEADTKTPYDQQLRFTNAVRAAGHHARIFPIDAKGETDHDAARMTIPVAGACARGDSDEKIYKGIPKRRASVASNN